MKIKLIITVLFLISSVVHAQQEYTQQQAQQKIADAQTSESNASQELQPKYYDAKNAANDTADDIQSALDNDLDPNHPDWGTFEQELNSLRTNIETAETNGSTGAQAFILGATNLTYANAAYASGSYTAAYNNASNALYNYNGACYYLRKANNDLIGGAAMYSVLEVPEEASIQTQLDILYAQVLAACN